MFEQSDIVGTDVLDHLGLVAATIDKLGIVEAIDKHLPMTILLGNHFAASRR